MSVTTLILQEEHDAEIVVITRRRRGCHEKTAVSICILRLKTILCALQMCIQHDLLEEQRLPHKHLIGLFCRWHCMNSLDVPMAKSLSFIPEVIL